MPTLKVREATLYFSLFLLFFFIIFFFFLFILFTIYIDHVIEFGAAYEQAEWNPSSQPGLPTLQSLTRLIRP